MAEYGLSGPEDFVEAAHQYRAAAKLQHAESMYNLGLMYAYARGVEHSYEKAAALFDSAANKHAHPAALYFLGLMHTHGHGVKLDYRMALKYFKLAALTVHPVALDAKKHVQELQALLERSETQGLAAAAQVEPGKLGELIQTAHSVLDSSGRVISAEMMGRDSSGKLAAARKVASQRARKLGEAISSTDFQTQIKHN
jgi:hypothetical protein